MSVLLNKKIIKIQPINSIRIKKELILDKIQDMNLANNENKDKNIQKKISFYKKVLVKPFTSRKKDNLNEYNNPETNNKIINKREVQNGHNLNDKMNFTNNEIFITFENKATIDNNEFSINNNDSEIGMNKILKSNDPNNFIYIKNENNYIKEEEDLSDNFRRIKNNNKFNNKNIISNQKDKDKVKFHIKEKTDEIKEIKDIFIYKKNNVINNGLNLSFFKGKRENVNINYINSISNNVYRKINSPIYFNKIYSLSNEMSDNLNLLNNMTVPSNNKIKRKINKNLKKKNLFNDTDLNIDMSRINEEVNPKYNYFNSITEINPNSNLGKLEISTLNNNENKREQSEDFNFFENKKKLLTSIEKEKENLLNENYNNYIKYIKLIQKQQQQYKEYDHYLKKELQKNRNKQIKLELFKENYFNTLQKSFKKREFGNFPTEFKTLSSNNFTKLKQKNKLTKSKKLPFYNLDNKIKILKSKIKKEKYESSLSNENSIYFIRMSKNKNTPLSKNNRIIKIKEDEFKKRNTTNLIKKSNKIMNILNSPNPCNFNNNITNVSHLNITNKHKPNLINDKSFNSGINNFFLENRTVKAKNKLRILNDNKNIKTDNREFYKNKNILNLNNENKSLNFQKFEKNIKDKFEKKYGLNKDNIHKELDHKNYLKYNKFKKFEDSNEYFFESKSNISNNILKNKKDKEKEIHKMITEVKKKIYNNLSEKKHNYSKIKKALYFSNSKIN